MTHGVRTDQNVDMLSSYDEEFPSSLLINSFDAANCPTLVGKPKIFLIQACRVYDGANPAPIQGQRIMLKSPQRGKDLSETAKNEEKVGIVNLPIMADIVVFRSTISSYPSFRNRIVGARFIQEFCNVFGGKDGIENDFLTNCTTVIRNITLKYGKTQQIQMPSITSMLIRKIIFETKTAAMSRKVLTTEGTVKKVETTSEEIVIPEEKGMFGENLKESNKIKETTSQIHNQARQEFQAKEKEMSEWSRKGETTQIVEQRN